MGKTAKKQKNHFLQKFIAYCLLIACLSAEIFINADTVFAATTTLQVQGNYYQTDARSMLAMVNSFRTGSDAWYWNSDNATKTVCSGLGTLSYDYNLEQIAMQRAAEIALYWSHTRPNGSDCFSCTYNGTQSYGENIAAGYSSVSSAFVGWREDDEAYSKQGHRRNMLRSGYTAIGIAHFKYNGTDYWVQEFGYSKSGAGATTANDSLTTKSVSVDSSLISDKKVLFYSGSQSYSSTSQTVYLGSTTSLPTAQVVVKIEGSWPSSYRPIAGTSVSWSTSNSSVVAISGSSFIAKGIGTATLTCTFSGSGLSGSSTYAVTVQGVSISGATVTLDAESYEYTGGEITPRVTSVTLNGTKLVNGIDYMISYSNNKNKGTGKVIITGIGKYSGSVTKTFTISCSHQSNTYEQTGTSYHYKYCSTCGAYVGYESHTYGEKTLISKEDYNTYYYYCTYEETCTKCNYKNTSHKIVFKEDIDGGSGNSNSGNTGGSGNSGSGDSGSGSGSSGSGSGSSGTGSGGSGNTSNWWDDFDWGVDWGDNDSSTGTDTSNDVSYGDFATYQGCSFNKASNGKITCKDANGNPVINDFKCDGTYTYYFQADGSAMKNRLTYHPDGEHVIYFDKYGHEVFSNFANVRKTIAGDAVDDYCFFDVYGYLYVDVVTYDQTGTKMYYANEYGVMPRGTWFQFSPNAKWAGTAAPTGEFAGQWGYAKADGTLIRNQYAMDDAGNVFYFQANGVVAP